MLAALGPKMLEVAAERSRGMHPYHVTPEHTRRAREAVGDWLRASLAQPNYANSPLRGDETAVKRRVDEHRAAGAGHVALQVLTGSAASPPTALPRTQWRRLAAAPIQHREQFMRAVIFGASGMIGQGTRTQSGDSTVTAAVGSPPSDAVGSTSYAVCCQPTPYSVRTVHDSRGLPVPRPCASR